MQIDVQRSLKTSKFEPLEDSKAKFVDLNDGSILNMTKKEDFNRFECVLHSKCQMNRIRLINHLIH